jgi:hypothetical protein
VLHVLCTLSEERFELSPDNRMPHIQPFRRYNLSTELPSLQMRGRIS